MSTIQFLENGVRELGLSLDIAPFNHYLELLSKWNKSYNLTAITALDEMITKHLFDSLSIMPYLKGKHIIDVGTGAGLPGIPLAIANKNLHIVLLDSNGKKIRFLQHVSRQLKLDNIEIVQSRVENYRPATGFDTVVSRAFSSISQMIQWTQHLVGPSGIWLAMKGRIPTQELATLTHCYEIKRLIVPNLDEERCCVLIEDDHHG